MQKKRKIKTLSLKKEKLIQLTDQGLKSVMGGEAGTSTCHKFLCGACTSSWDSSNPPDPTPASSYHNFTCDACTTYTTTPNDGCS